MCLGIPMQVLHGDEWSALCAADGAQRRVSMALVGAQDAGTWLLVQQDTAREVLSAEGAQKITLALAGVAAALRGEADLTPYFRDLVSTPPRAPGQ
ncbi:HypC/HybG/HupF family hydrogenase formation chaperone [Metallibacterium sp.]|uniref:HypC/HybG/HupF family hydrogenase formation chaperone n=1 Tax=Metallibacterium sp. TaxID=2940281 RepID=UPI00261B1725|nr:HypC/HybG/HupF family hydrogenase formation chaperone [Metallibacterium sp.]